MMDADPTRRPSATEALSGAYLGGCSPAGVGWGVGGGGDPQGGGGEAPLRETPSAPLVESSADECSLYQAATPFSVELPIGRARRLRLRRATDGLGTEIAAETAAEIAAEIAEMDPSDAPLTVREGDTLLGVGPVDTQASAPEEVAELLERWRAPTAKLHLVRAW